MAAMVDTFDRQGMITYGNHILDIGGFDVSNYRDPTAPLIFGSSTQVVMQYFLESNHLLRPLT